MPKYQVVQEGDRLFVPIRYDNFRALGADVRPAVPWTLVPLHRSIADVLVEARALRAEADRELSTKGVGRVRRLLMEAPNLPSDEEPQTIGYLDRLVLPLRIFRGERSLRFNIMPTRYRFAGEPDPLATTRERIRCETQHAGRMQEYLKGHGMPQASIAQARAAARHYGVPSSFVDFSFSPDVAAFFGHPAFNDHEREGGADVGILYTLGLQDFDKLFGLAAWTIPPDGGREILHINIRTAWRIPYRSYDPDSQVVEDAVLEVPAPARLLARAVSIRTCTVPAIPRIVAQEGLFVDLAFEDPEDWWAQVFLWTVLDFASRKWCFLRQDFAYENAQSGITSATLLPPDDGSLAQLTSGLVSSP